MAPVRSAPPNAALNETEWVDVARHLDTSSAEMVLARSVLRVARHRSVGCSGCTSAADAAVAAGVPGGSGVACGAGAGPAGPAGPSGS